MTIKNYIENTWILKNPTILYRAIRGFLRSFLFHKNTLKTIEIFPTFKCNLKCAMCSISKYDKSDGEPLNLKEYELIAKEGAKLGAIAVQILGGEPLIATNLEEIISIFKKEKYFVYLVSNSTLASHSRLKKLKESGLDAIAFSLDSLKEDSFQKIRGEKSSVIKVLEAAEVAKNLGLNVRLSVVFFHNKLKEGIEVIEYCKKHNLGASGSEVAAVGNAENSEILTPEEHNQVRELLKSYPSLTFDWSLSYFLKFKCPAGKEKIAITTFGDVVGCSLNPISFGNIREEKLATILKRMERFSQFAKDSPVCLAAEDTYYIDNYLKPLKNFDSYPVNFKELEEELCYFSNS